MTHQMLISKDQNTVEMLNPGQELHHVLKSSSDQQNSFSFNQDQSKDPVNFAYSSLSKMTPEINSTAKSSVINEHIPKQAPKPSGFKKSGNQEGEVII